MIVVLLYEGYSRKMSIMNANIHRLAAIWRLLATDTELSWCVSSQDIEAFYTRVTAEGLNFLTTELPRLGKALDRSFQTGQLSPIEGFRSMEGEAYPLFLRNAWSCLFDKQGALLWDTTDGEAHGRDESSRTGLTFSKGCLNTNSPFRCPEQQGAALCIRQLSYAFYKLDVPYSDEQTQAVISRFRENEDDLHRLYFDEHELDRISIRPGHMSARRVLTDARNLLRRLLDRYDPTDIRPKHGSGSSACKVKPWDRWKAPRFVRSLDRVFPYADYWFAGAAHLCDSYREMADWTEADELGARVTFVPKDSRGPRLISAEPREHMFIQQGIMHLLYDIVASHRAIANQVGFTDQTRNQRLARLGSENGRYATLDLKDASDRVSWRLVQKLFPPRWVKAFEACRSPFTTLPDGTNVRLAKFAPMGSALCFPVEALTFWSLITAAMLPGEAYIRRLLKGRLSPLEQMCISVFGDDIIVEQPHYELAIQTLETFGLKVNTDKSYSTGPFRESCGHDYYQGSLVTPVRINNPLVGDNDETCFRTVDVFQNIINRYGQYSNDVIWRCHSLFREWYGIDLPIVPTNARHRRETGAQASKLLLEDPDHMTLNTCDCQTLHPKRKWRTGAPKLFSDRVIPVKFRSSSRNGKEMRVLTEVAHEITREYDSWCFVHKALLTGGPRNRAGQWALPKRNRYKYGWTAW